MRSPWFPHEDRPRAFWTRFHAETYGDTWRDETGRWRWMVTLRGAEIARGGTRSLKTAMDATNAAWEKKK